MPPLQPLSSSATTTARLEAQASLLARLRSGEDAAFAELVNRYSASMLAVARTFVPSRAVAEEVVQDTWLAAIAGLGRFEGRSSLRTWLFSILVNRARTTGRREHRVTPTASEQLLEGDRTRPGHWAAPRERCEDSPAASLESGETIAAVLRAIDVLPPRQRRVMALRDLDGRPSAEVRDTLGISAGNQRVLLHRARSRIRPALEPYVAA